MDTDQNVLIDVTAYKGGPSGTAVIFREVQLQCPTTRVAELDIVLASDCVGVLSCPAQESCDPTTGACGSDQINASLLPPYDPNRDAGFTLPPPRGEKDASMAEPTDATVADGPPSVVPDAAMTEASEAPEAATVDAGPGDAEAGAITPGCGPSLTSCGTSCVNEGNDPNNCGACAHTCPSPTSGIGTPGCSSTQCTLTCGAALTLCSGACVNEQSDGNNCGACGTVCGGGTTCQSGTCTCPPGLTSCSGTCVNEQTDPANCGACVHACSGPGSGAGSQVCNVGACSLTCGAGLSACSGSCVNEQSDGSNCGACGTVCGGGTTCQSGACACPSGLTSCSGTCVNEVTALANCGSCGHACPAPTAGSGSATCTGSTCGLLCGSGLSSCGGACVNEQSDPNNCGVCGTTCGGGMTCQTGKCACPSGIISCSGTCVNEQTDDNNCGACAHGCAPPTSGTGSAVCSGGACGLSCTSGQTSCGGACVNEQTDGKNCGACGTTCGTGTSCQSGACNCVSGLSPCSGACVNEQTDPNNCGACAHACMGPSSGTGSQVCSGGGCSLSCGTGLTSCGGACVNEQTDGNNCGACSTVCGGGMTCQTGKCNCPSGLVSCSGNCINEQTDVNNCGSCADVCPGPTTGSGNATCSGGACGLSCGAGLTACSGACANEQTNPNNCGACGTVCAGGMTCQSGTCQCPTGLISCGGTCENEQTDKNNCGACGTTCNISCAAGACVVVSGLATGLDITCAVLSNGTVMCWGSGDNGELGNGTVPANGSPTPVLVSGITTATAVAAGNQYVCALLSGGGVDCWGLNNAGQLGIGNTTSAITPQPVVGLTGTATAITVGALHTCALLSTGAVDCWGLNNQGQLGLPGNTTNQSTPQAVTALGTGVTAISAGQFHTCALMSNKSVECWGDNELGQLGNGTTSTSPNPSPATVSGVTSATLISAGYWHTCTANSNGMQCWGDNTYGELGNGSTSTTPITSPVTVMHVGTPKLISAGDGFTFWTQAGGKVGAIMFAGWGDNEWGDLANGTTTSSSTPVTVPGFTNSPPRFVSVGPMAQGVCVSIGNSGECAGYNAEGQLGNGNTTNQSSLQPIAW